MTSVRSPRLMVTTISMVIEIRNWLPGAERIDWKGQEVIFWGDRNILDLNLVVFIYKDVCNFQNSSNYTQYLCILLYVNYLNKKCKIKIYILKLYRVVGIILPLTVLTYLYHNK